MESGRIFVVPIDQSLSSVDKSANWTEIDLKALGIKNKIVGFSDYFRYLWTQEGEIYEYVDSTHELKLVSDHDLQDGSKIKEVHEIAISASSRNHFASFARVTTTHGD